MLKKYISYIYIIYILLREKTIYYRSVLLDRLRYNHDINTYDTLYRSPRYLTDNNNRDILVFDVMCYAVVATSGEGIHRFSYLGLPSLASRLTPDGICTDVMSHILVCDGRSSTVQMLDRDGRFLSIFLTRQTPGIDYRPRSLSYDANTHVVLVGTLDHNRICMCLHINRHLHLSGKFEYIVVHV